MNAPHIKVETPNGNYTRADRAKEKRLDVIIRQPKPRYGSMIPVIVAEKLALRIILTEDADIVAAVEIDVDASKFNQTFEALNGKILQCFITSVRPVNPVIEYEAPIPERSSNVLETLLDVETRLKD